MMSTMPNCREVTEAASDLLDGRIPLRRRMWFYMHLSMCRHCRAYLRQLRTTIATLGRLPDEPMPPRVRDLLLAAYRRAAPADRP